MHKITSVKSGVDIGVTDSLRYIKRAPNGCLVQCEQYEAQGVAFMSNPYCLEGYEKDIPEHLDVVRVTELDGGEWYLSHEYNTSLIDYVAMMTGVELPTKGEETPEEPHDVSE